MASCGHKRKLPWLILRYYPSKFRKRLRKATESLRIACIRTNFEPGAPLIRSGSANHSTSTLGGKDWSVHLLNSFHVNVFGHKNWRFLFCCKLLRLASFLTLSSKSSHIKKQLKVSLTSNNIRRLKDQYKQSGFLSNRGHTCIPKPQNR